MPTVILLDVSLSMARQVNCSDNSNRLIDLASGGLINFFDQLSVDCKLEYTAFVVFSSLYEILVKFTRDISVLKNACLSLDTYDKTVFESAFQCVETLVTEEWGLSVPINLVLITDGRSGIGDGSLKESLRTMSSRNADSQFPIPFSFPCHLSIMCLSKDCEDYLKQLISLNNERGELILPDSVSEVGVARCFSKLLNIHYNRYEAALQCGHFLSTITLSPAPNFQNSLPTVMNTYHHEHDVVDVTKLKLGSVLNIIGFMDLQDICNPPYMSRHVVLPVVSISQDGKSMQKDAISFQPSFCVLLHGSLKMKKMGAIVKLGEDWYGMLYSWADNKKKSTLMLSVFEPNQPFPWLGLLKNLGPAYELNTIPYQLDAKEDTEETPFPVPPSGRRSYHLQSNAVWIKSSGLQSDLQKLLRYAKKLPEKQSAFFKEVNRIRRAGVIYGFHELLYELAITLESEAARMSPEAIVQLRHVAEGLRNAPYREVNKNIIAINMFRKKSTDT